MASSSQNASVPTQLKRRRPRFPLIGVFFGWAEASAETLPCVNGEKTRNNECVDPGHTQTTGQESHLGWLEPPIIRFGITQVSSK